MSSKSSETTTTAPHAAKKSVENTVFVRFQPPSDAIRRHHVEDLFSEIGPIKKSSVIHNTHNSNKDQHVVTSSSYGFVKYTVPEDAEMAAVKLNNRTLQLTDNSYGSVKSVVVKVERAEKDYIGKGGGGRKSSKHKQAHPHAAENENHNEEAEETSQLSKKKTNRLIVRNLSFYAKEKDIRKALSVFGELVEVHIPTVAQTGGHRGFCFVTYDTEKAVQRCLKNAATSSNNIVIKDRAVNIARALHKTAYQAQKPPSTTAKQATTTATVRNGKEDEKKRKVNEDEESSSTSDGSSSSSSSDSEEDHGSDSSNEDEQSGNDDDDSESGETKKRKRQNRDSDTTAVAEKRCLFLRNLPFDCSRHDVFEAFRQFGYITAIYIVKDKETHSIPKGTAFVSFEKPEQATKALEFASAAAASSRNSFVSQRNATTVEEQYEQLHGNHNDETRNTSGGGIVLKGRRLLVDLAVDKETATALTVTERKQNEASGKDKRNLYLKGEGRVENDEQAGVMSWDELPETDKLKRQTAWSEKNTKLRSPLFFINPIRLSFRNLAKHVDEAALKELCVRAIQRGLENNLVTPQDQVAHWRAGGEMTTREILARIQAATMTDQQDDTETSGGSIIPPFDEKNVKQFIPSVHIHRDYVPGGNKKVAPSRGFGFVEFAHHLHALACLRELNNNTRYSAEFATGGKQATEMKRRRVGKKKQKQPSQPSVSEGSDEKQGNFLGEDGRVRIPRLIVEFTVENKAKAKQQAEHRAQQQANLVKQLEQRKMEAEQSGESASKTKKKKQKKSRGKTQRERKRKQLEEGTGASNQPTAADDAKNRVTRPESGVAVSKPEKRKAVKPPKKQRIDKSEETFSKLVDSYTKETIGSDGDTAREGASNGGPAKKKGNKRWFE